MSVEIKEVLTKKELWAWVRFPNKLYKNNKYFVPFLENDEFDEIRHRQVGCCNHRGYEG